MQPRLVAHPVRLAGASLLRLQSDERLVELARAGHEGAFAAIVHRHRPALLRYCTRLLGAERAEDAVQQALVNAHAAMTSGDRRPLELRPWLYRVAHNAAVNVLRRARDEAPLTEAVPGDPSVGPAEVAERREQLRAALDAVAALPPAQRDALLLRELEGRSHEAIALALGVTPGAARQHLYRARAALRAGVTAVTPAPLLARLADAGAPDAAVGAGLGLGAGAFKLGAGMLAAGAVVGGTVGGGALRHGGHDAPAIVRGGAGQGIGDGGAPRSAGLAAGEQRDGGAGAASGPSDGHGTGSGPGRHERHRDHGGRGGLGRGETGDGGAGTGPRGDDHGDGNRTDDGDGARSGATGDDDRGRTGDGGEGGPSGGDDHGRTGDGAESDATGDGDHDGTGGGTGGGLSGDTGGTGDGGGTRSESSGDDDRGGTRSESTGGDDRGGASGTGDGGDTRSGPTPDDRGGTGSGFSDDDATTAPTGTATVPPDGGSSAADSGSSEDGGGG